MYRINRLVSALAAVGFFTLCLSGASRSAPIYHFESLLNTRDNDAGLIGFNAPSIDQWSSNLSFWGTTQSGDGIYAQRNGHLDTIARDGSFWAADRFGASPVISGRNVAFTGYTNNNTSQSLYLFDDTGYHLYAKSSSSGISFMSDRIALSDRTVVALADYQDSSERLLKLTGGAPEVLASTNDLYRDLLPGGISPNGAHISYAGKLNDNKRYLERRTGNQTFHVAGPGQFLISTDGKAINSNAVAAAVGHRTDGSQVLYTANGTDLFQIHASSANFYSLGNPSINDSGLLTFFGRSKSSGRNGLWLSEIGGTASKLLEEGDTIPNVGVVAGLDFVGATGMNNQNSIVFNITTTDNQQHMILATQVGSTTPPPVRQPPPSLVRLRAPSSDQMLPLHGTSTLDLSKPTIVLSHGWNNGVDDWPIEMAMALRASNSNVNIVAWDWSDVASSYEPITVGSRAPSQGTALGQSLVATLGPDYDQTIHLIGHSFGTRLNKAAADYMYPFYGADKLHVTVLDSAESTVLGERILPYSTPIPAHGAAYIDAYISAFGARHAEAVNTLIFENFPSPVAGLSPLGLFQTYAEFHEDPIDFYRASILSYATAVGHRFAFETNGIGGAPARGSNYGQVSGLNVAEISPTSAAALIAARELQLAGKLALSTRDILMMIRGAPQSVGKVTTAVQGNAFSILLEENSPAYAWLPVSIPPDATMMAFDFWFNGLGKDDALSVGINETLLYALEGGYLPSDTMGDSGLIDVSAFSGTDVELFIGLISDGISGGSIGLQNIRFVSAVPALDGDFNLDGSVDAADYVLWREETVGGSSDGFDIWRSNFGTSDVGSGLYDTAVPEPATAALFVLGLFAFRCRRANR